MDNGCDLNNALNTCLLSKECKMKNVARASFVTIALLGLAACETTVSPSYQNSPSNTIALQSIATSGARASVASVTAAPDVNVNPTCRLMGSLDIGGGLSAEQVLMSALQSELLAGGMYAPDGTPISVTLTNLKVESFSGYWAISGTVRTPKMPQGYDVQTRFDYKTSFSAYSACHNSAIAFNRAVAAFINAIVTHPSFRQAI
jgi:hypothetical protein